MTQSAETQKEMASLQEQGRKASADAQAQSDAWMKDDQLARARGNLPEQIEARKRVARLFCDIHWNDEAKETRENRLALIDYAEPLFPVNGRTVEAAKPKSTGFLGMGRKPAYLVSEKFPPKLPEDPIYCLQYLPIKR